MRVRRTAAGGVPRLWGAGRGFPLAPAPFGGILRLFLMRNAWGRVPRLWARARAFRSPLRPSGGILRLFWLRNAAWTGFRPAGRARAFRSPLQPSGVAFLGGAGAAGRSRSTGKSSGATARGGGACFFGGSARSSTDRQTCPPSSDPPRPPLWHIQATGRNVLAVVVIFPVVFAAEDNPRFAFLVPLFSFANQTEVQRTLPRRISPLTPSRRQGRRHPKVARASGKPLPAPQGGTPPPSIAQQKQPKDACRRLQGRAESPCPRPKARNTALRIAQQ